MVKDLQATVAAQQTILNDLQAMVAAQQVVVTGLQASVRTMHGDVAQHTQELHRLTNGMARLAAVNPAHQAATVAERRMSVFNSYAPKARARPP